MVWSGATSRASRMSLSGIPTRFLCQYRERRGSHRLGGGGNHRFCVGSPQGRVERRQLVRVSIGYFPFILRNTAHPKKKALNIGVGQVILAEILAPHDWVGLDDSFLAESLGKDFDHLIAQWRGVE